MSSGQIKRKCLSNRIKLGFSLGLLLGVGALRLEAKPPLKKEPAPSSIETALRPLNQKKGRLQRPYEDLDEAKVDIKKTKDLLGAIELILKNDKQIDSKVDLYVKKAYLLYSLGKKTKLQADQEVVVKSPIALQSFDQAMGITDQLLIFHKKKALLTKQQQALIHFVRGSIAFELNRDEQMLSEFQTSLKAEPKTKQSPSMSLIIAEHYFDHDRFEEAIKFYQDLYDSYDGQQKGIADYKTAWCYLIMKNQLKAEEFFLRSIYIQPHHSLTEDSIRDLAYISSQIRTEPQNLDFAKQKFSKSLNDRAAFLLALIRQMFAIDKKKIPYKLFNEAFKTNRSLNEKVQILGILISYERREYPTKGQIIAFNHLYNLVARTKPERVASMLASAKQLPEDLEFYIKIFVDGYMQKVQSFKINDTGQIVEVLNRLIPFHLDHFGVEKNLILYYSLWTDIARKEEDLALLDGISKHWTVKKIRFSAPELDQKIDNRLRLELIGLLEKKSVLEPSLKPRHLKELLDFVERYPADKNVLPISKRISEIYLAEKKYKEAVPYLKTIYLKEPNVDHFYNLKLAAFQLGEFDSVTNDPETYKYEKEDRVLDLLREANLKQAAKYLANNEFGKYEENIRLYLKSKPEEKKAVIVLSDYFSKLLERKEGLKLCAEFGAISQAMKAKKELTRFVEAALDQMFGEGAFYECSSFGDLTADSALNAKVILYQRCFNKPLTDSEMVVLKNFGTEKRRSILGLMALGQPKEAITYFQKKGPADEIEKTIYLVALKMHQKTEKPHLVGAEVAMFKTLLDTPIPKFIPTKIEKLLAQFLFPTEKMSRERYSKVMEDVLYRIKVLRKVFLKDSPAMPDAQRIQVLVKLADSEKRVGQVILDSPRPEGLEPAQLESYNQELAAVAKEYGVQADEYLKIKGEIEKRIGDLKAQIEAAKVPPIDMALWPWPSGPVTEKVRTLVKDRGLFSTLVYLDYQRNAGIIKEKDYFLLRGGALMSRENHEALRNYVRDELLAADLGTVVEDWRKGK